MKQIISVFSLLVSLAIGQSAGAQEGGARPFSLADAIAALNGERGDSLKYAMERSLDGAGSALLWANSRLIRTRNVTPLFCPPDTLALNVENYRQIAFDRYKNDSYIKLSPAGIEMAANYGVDALTKLLFDGLIETFPCK